MKENKNLSLFTLNSPVHGVEILAGNDLTSSRSIYDKLAGFLFCFVFVFLIYSASSKVKVTSFNVWSHT